MASEPERALGKLVGRYPTDNGRRGRVALWALVVGVPVTAVGVPMMISAFENVPDDQVRRPGYLAGLVLGVGLVGLWVGLTAGLAYLRRHGEEFMVREGGLVYRRTGLTRAVPWEAIASVKNSGEPFALWRVMGRDVQCRIRLRRGQGGSLRVTGFTQDAKALVDTVSREVDARRGR
jgi:hypothetical protein